MNEKVEKFYKKYRLSEATIMYIDREDAKTLIHTTDGRVVDTFIPIKSLIEDFDDKTFVIINKGICLNANYITSINNGIYLMKDGTKFQGRVRGAGEHKQMQKTIAEINSASASEGLTGITSAGGKNDFSAFEDLPIAICILEMKYDNKNSGMNYIFRYCNKNMESLQGLRREAMLGKTFNSIFRDADPKWLITFGDVALNGGQRIIDFRDPVFGRKLRIYCYQPSPVMCGCLFVPM